MNAIPPLSFNTKISYGIGQTSEGIKNGALKVFIFFYYTQVLGLSTSLTGIAVFIALIADAITDPLVGSLSDSWRSRLGRRHPFLYAAALPLAISLVGLYSPPELSELGLFVWLTVFAISTTVSITLFHVPHMSLGAELSSDFHERTAIVAYRFFFGYTGQMLAYFIGFYIFFADSPDFPHGGQFNREAYLPFGITMAAITLVVVLWSAWGTQSRIIHLVQPTVQHRYSGAWSVLRKAYADLGDALTNVSFRWLFVGALISYTMVGTDQALNLHMNTYFWELPSEGNLFFFMATPVGAVIGTFFCRKTNERFGKKQTLIFGSLWWVTCQTLPVVLRLVDYFPENGTTELVWTLIAIKFVQGLGVVQALVTSHSMMADITDAHELRTGKRQEGTFFAALSFSNKVTTGLGAAIAGFVLTAIAWPIDTTIRTAADVPADTLMWLGIVYGPIVATFALLSIYCYSRYDLDEARHQEIVVQLDKMRLNNMQKTS